MYLSVRSDLSREVTYTDLEISLVGDITFLLFLNYLVLQFHIRFVRTNQKKTNYSPQPIKIHFTLSFRLLFSSVQDDFRKRSAGRDDNFGSGQTLVRT